MTIGAGSTATSERAGRQTGWTDQALDLAQQIRDLAGQIVGQLGLSGHRTRRINPQVECESWRLLASLERLDRACVGGW